MIMRVLCNSEAAEDCPFFGSEAGCYAVLHGRKCDFRHERPNTVEGCKAGDTRCLKTAACPKRHRVWRSWQDCEAFYCRRGPYDRRATHQGHGAAASSGSSGSSGAAFSYAKHLSEVTDAKHRFEMVCGRGGMPSHGGVRGMAARYGKGFMLACRHADDVAEGVVEGRGLGRARQGLAEPVHHKALRMEAERSWFFPKLGIGCPVPDRSDADPMGDSLSLDQAMAALKTVKTPLSECFTGGTKVEKSAED